MLSEIIRIHFNPLSQDCFINLQHLYGLKIYAVCRILHTCISWTVCPNLVYKIFFSITNCYYSTNFISPTNAYYVFTDVLCGFYEKIHVFFFFRFFLCYIYKYIYIIPNLVTLLYTYILYIHI